MRQRNSRSSGLISKIDVSALAAVLFVLLFLFMMLTSTTHHGVSADLPKVWHPKSMPGANREDALTVVILRDSPAQVQSVFRDRLGVTWPAFHFAFALFSRITASLRVPVRGPRG